MRLRNYIYPTLIYKSLVLAIKDKSYFVKYSGILNDLEEEGKLEKMGFRKDGSRLLIGVNLNPELLMYTEDKESAELKFISDSMKKYTDFLQKEGILDVIKADYERVFTEDHYGYIVQIGFDYKNYKADKFKYDLGYVAVASSIVIGVVIFVLQSIL